MITHSKINCDVGEGVGNEPQLMPYIQYCNIACGGHSGDANSMEKMVDLAIKNDVLIGAHPSYPDIKSFGRKTIDIPENELVESIRFQINNLIAIAKKRGAKLFHIKPHGALYNDVAKEELLALTFLKAIEPYKDYTKLFVPFNSVIQDKASKNEFEIIYEAFADRNYNNDLSLVSRSFKNATISIPEKVIKHVDEIMTSGKVTTISNKKIAIKADTFCVHSDTENAILLVKALNKLICNK